MSNESGNGYADYLSMTGSRGAPLPGMTIEEAMDLGCSGMPLEPNECVDLYGMTNYSMFGSRRTTRHVKRMKPAR